MLNKFATRSTNPYYSTMIKFTKQLTLVIAMFLATAFSLQLFAEDTPAKGKSRIDILIESEEKSTERALPISVEGIIDYDAQLIELTCYGLKSCYIYILDSFGQICDTYTYDFQEEWRVVLSTPTVSGTYYIILISDGIYGEGIFKIIT